MNCNFHIMSANSNHHLTHLQGVALCGQPNCLPHHTSGKCNRHVEGYVALSFAICWLNHCPLMHWSSVIIPFLMKCPCFTWCLITIRDVSQWSVYLSKWVKVTIMLRFHLSQSVMTAIACNVWPTWFLSDDLIETLELLVIKNPWMCIKFQMIYWISSCIGVVYQPCRSNRQNGNTCPKPFSALQRTNREGGSLLAK